MLTDMLDLGVRSVSRTCTVRRVLAVSQRGSNMSTYHDPTQMRTYINITHLKKPVDPASQIHCEGECGKYLTKKEFMMEEHLDWGWVGKTCPACREKDNG